MKPRSTRLNQYNRDKFIRRVISDLMPSDKQPDMDDFVKRWKDKVYDLVYGPYKELMDQLPDWFFEEDDDVTVRFRVSSNDTYNVTFPQGKRVKIARSGYGYHAKYPELPDDAEIVQDYKQQRQLMHDWGVKQRELENQIRQLVYSCNTSGQLYAAWPDAEKYADCFPYKGPQRFEGPDVSKEEIDIAIQLSKLNVKLPDET